MNLLKYIQGKRKGKEAHRLEKEAMHDPFLADALEGYAKVEGDHLRSIEELQRRIVGKKSNNKRLIWTFGVAASLLTGVFIGGYYLLQTDKNINSLITYESSPVIKEIVSEEPVLYEEELIPDQTDSLSLPTLSGEIIARVQEDIIIPPPVAPNVNEEVITVIEDSDIVEVVEIIKIIEEDPVEESLIAEAMEETEVEVKSIHMAESSPGRVTSAPSALSGKAVGTVIDRDGEPIIGASVVVQGTQKGTVTDIDGNFILDISPDDDILSVNYIGYESLTLPIDTGRGMMIAMNESRDMLDEVVVVGYGTQKKKSLTGAVSSVAPSSMPKPLIGDKEYKNYLKSNIRYPEDEDFNKKKGKVKLSFYVDGNGRPYDIRVEENLCTSNDNEAIRLVEQGPDWTLGNDRVTLEVKF